MGNAASINNSAGTVTVSGLTNMTTAAVGGTLTIYGAASGGNNGPFPVATFVSTTSVTITNGGSPAGADGNNGSIGWSLDWDNSAYIGPIDKQITSATDLATPETNHGLYTWSSSNPAFLRAIDNDSGPAINNVFTPGLPPGSGGGGSVTLYYKMVGYYVTGAVYESFVATGSPAPSTTTNPNTSHTLINTYVASFYSR